MLSHDFEFVIYHIEDAVDKIWPLIEKSERPKIQKT